MKLSVDDYLLMTHRLTTNYAKNYCNRTLIVKVIVENVVTFFWDTVYKRNSCYKCATESAERAQPQCFVYRPPVRPIVPICPSICHTGGSIKNG